MQKTPLSGRWKGPTTKSLTITANETDAKIATLAFGSGPDFEAPGDANKDNVYEVTIVVTDNTDLADELDVTVKVINSTDDNEPGVVSVL